MDIKVKGNGLFGEINAIASKSDAHRALICAALSDRKSRVNFSKSSEDIDATLSCLASLGAKIIRDENGAEIEPVKKQEKDILLDCSESGSTLRFMIPVSLAVNGKASFTGRGRLSERPLGVLLKELENHGCSFSEEGRFPLEACGRPTGGKYVLRGDVSSQFITGIMLSLPLIGGGEIEIKEPIESEKYILMTADTMKKYGVDVKRNGNTFSVSGVYKIINDTYFCEGDWSNAAFFLAAGAVNGNVTVRNLSASSLQSDREIAKILDLFGADVIMRDGEISVSSGKLKCAELDFSQMPDLVPIAAVCACFAEGRTKICGAKRLRLKESDRLLAVSETLGNIGFSVTQTDDGLCIDGSPSHKAVGECDSFGDHRIVMSVSIAAAVSGGEVIIRNAQAVNKSYPSFFEELKKLGGEAYVI